MEKQIFAHLKSLAAAIRKGNHFLASWSAHTRLREPDVHQARAHAGRRESDKDSVLALFQYSSVSVR